MDYNANFASAVDSNKEFSERLEALRKFSEAAKKISAEITKIKEEHA